MKLGIILSFVLFVSFAALADHPCKPKREAKHAARQALHACLDAWSQDHHAGDADPGDDCVSKTQAFVQAAKDVKTCVTEHKMKK